MKPIKFFSRPLLILIALLPFEGSFQDKITITSKRNDDNSITYSYQKNTPGSHFIYLDIQQIGNAIAPREFMTVSGRSGNLFTLKPINEKMGINFRFSYGYLRGEYNPKPDFDFVYALPFRNGKEIKVDELSNIRESAGAAKKGNWKAFQFTTSSRTDSVFVARKGLVVEVVEDMNRDYNQEYSFKQEANYVIIEHRDGTLARYGVLEKNSVVPEVGDEVFPGDFLAMAGTYDKLENKQLRFYVYYLNKVDKVVLNNPRTVADGNVFYSYVNPVFLTAEGLSKLKKGDFATAAISEELITQEMSKREKKKRAKK
ncbi:hypothetical protein [Muriicola marianensis]|uniref:Peptidoglycan DD-metalloendopeptidase family protein n=1 Tax=Muriicola marianensis TaxID=1324801 RepID=A0ABQ1QXU7_9FLAO|nr:hypothetical protein [Muriicola marianensis]GGD47537.1 hypothetical protein GCM10011361_12880 [Muriicola marianensis]